MESKKVNIGTIGHVDHGKTTLTAAISSIIASSDLKQKTIHESIEDDESLCITNHLNNIPKLIGSNQITDGQSSRRERRKQQRKNRI